MRTILHVDMNSYFATVEQQANPYLRGKPVGIIKAEGRGCVIAASIEAKKFGVKTGCTVWEAKKLCPQIILVPSDMDKYFALTQRLIKIIGDYSPTVEVFSIDECFMDVTDTQKLFGGGVLEIALEIKQRVKRDLGEWMRCSVGIGFSKLSAKLASEMDKPDGLTWLTQENYLDKTEQVAVHEVCGIGYARSKYLYGRGAFTLGQARQLPDLPREIYDLIGLRNNEKLITIEDLDPAKSVSRTFTTFSNLNSQDSILKLVRNLIEEATGKMREMKMAGRTFCLTLDGFWARRTIKMPTDDPLIIFDLLKREYERNPLLSVRFAGINISNLMLNTQYSMFNKREKILQVVDRVNQKWGLFSLYPAQLLGGELVRPEVTGYLGDKYYRLTSRK